MVRLPFVPLHLGLGATDNRPGQSPSLKPKTMEHDLRYVSSPAFRNLA